MDIQAVLFDCDGLMFNTEVIAQEIWKETANKYHFSLPADFFKQITGSEVKKELLEDPTVGEIFTEANQKRYDLNFWKKQKIDSMNKKGLVELFDYLEEKKIHAVICSSSPKQYVEVLLERVSKPLSYEFIIGGDSVSHKKPDPEIFLKASALLSVKPEQCLVLEDSKNGIIAAHRANMHHCFIEDTIEKDDELEKLIEFEEKDLNGVIQLLNKVSIK